MSIKINFIFMSILVLGLIGNTAVMTDLAFADKPDKEAAKKDREEAKEFSDSTVVTSLSTTLTSSDTESSEKVTICHIPPGNPGNNHTISVGSPAVGAHLAHGDIDEPCDFADFEDYQAKKELRLAEELTNKELSALERAEKLIEKLEQQIGNLEKRLQNLLEKYESGEYYGNISAVDDVTNFYVISFSGTALSIFDESVTTNMSGELRMENQVTASNTSKFKITTGEIEIGEAVYDIAFGKARA